MLKIKDILKKPQAIFAILILVIMLFIAIFAPLIAPYSPYEIVYGSELTPPVFMDKGSWKHILGTDDLGRDMLSRLFYGARISLFISILCVTISAFIFLLLLLFLCSSV